MNLRVKKIIMLVAVTVMVMGTGAISASANTITKAGIKNAWSGPGEYQAFAWTGTTGGYAYAQVWGTSHNANQSGYEIAGAVGYNSWAQTSQKAYSINTHRVEGRHWSDNQYKVSNP